MTDAGRQGHLVGPISLFLARDHERLERLLDESVLASGAVDPGAFGAFREGLLRHIALEEKLLIPAATAARHGEPLAFARRLRVDHGALAALLVPTPTPSTREEIRKILVPHDALEEGPGGPYESCDALLSADESALLLQRMRAYPPVRVARYHDGPRVCRTAEEALRVSGQQVESRPTKA